MATSASWGQALSCVGPDSKKLPFPILILINLLFSNSKEEKWLITGTPIDFLFMKIGISETFSLIGGIYSIANRATRLGCTVGLLGWSTRLLNRSALALEYRASQLGWTVRNNGRRNYDLFLIKRKNKIWLSFNLKFYHLPIDGFFFSFSLNRWRTSSLNQCTILLTMHLFW